MTDKPLTDGDCALAPPPPEPKALTPAQVLRLGAFTVAEERSEGVEQLLTEQEQVYRDVLRRQGPEPLIEALLMRDRMIAGHGRTLADGRAASRLLREAMRAVLYQMDAQEVRQLANKADVETVLQKLGAEPADARQIKAHGSTLGPLAPLEDTYGPAVGGGKDQV